MTTTIEIIKPSALPSLDIDRENLMIMGIVFPDVNTLDNIASAITSNMFAGFRPTKKDIELIKELSLGNQSVKQLIEALKEEMYRKQ